jgi:hypothetical protein
VSGNFLPFAAVIRLSGLGSELIIFPNYRAKIGEPNHQAKRRQQTEKREYHDREELVFFLG